ncbi:PPE family protein [Mycobacterium sp.]|uniref:PPE family protein n=1 Tax=Mycobacterium sp. TaxID=1785 RepID=UPI003BAF39FE
MDFSVLPPEINSARMYSGPGSGPLMAAATAWDELATELGSTADSYSSVISGLTGAEWLGPSSASMAAAAAPYATWMSTTAAQAEQAAAQAMAAASAYEAAFAMTVPPPVIAANRSLTMMLIATNILGQNTAAIAANEAQYAEMWAQDSAAMQGYAADSEASTTLRPFTAPPQTTNPAGLAGQAGTVAQAAAPAAAIGTIGDGVLVSLNLISLASLGISCAILGQGAVGLTDQHRGETGPPVELATVGQPNPGTGGLVSRIGNGAAVSTLTGRASSIGGLSVPPSWATPLAVRQIAAAFPGTAPIIMQNSQTTADSPYTGMALASVVGTSMAGLASRGAPAASAAATTPAANKGPAATVVAANKPTPAAARAATPVAPNVAFPSTVPVEISAAGIPADVAANLAATLAGIPGATIVVIPPPPPPG